MKERETVGEGGLWFLGAEMACGREEVQILIVASSELCLHASCYVSPSTAVALGTRTLWSIGSPE